MYAVAQLADALADSPETSYVRLVAHWLTNGEVDPVDPGLTGDPIVDALVGAAVAHLALQRRIDIPGWTNQRRLPRFWHPGSDAFFAYALAHSPLAFKSRGILIERDSLESV